MKVIIGLAIIVLPILAALSGKLDFLSQFQMLAVIILGCAGGLWVACHPTL